MYDSKTNTYTVEGISENEEITEGADVVTTGMGTVFPKWSYDWQGKKGDDG